MTDKGPAQAAWKKRLRTPNCRVLEAARYAGISRDTVARWYKATDTGALLSDRAKGAALSYMQLIEIAVVAAFRKAGVRMQSIKETRKYLKDHVHSEFPFAEYRFKRDGKRLIMPDEDLHMNAPKGIFLRPDQQGQLVWAEVLGRLEEFDYEGGEIVTRWYVAGRDSQIVIDPRLSFGAPSIRGTPTWVIRDRAQSGASAEEIAEDFGLTTDEVTEALVFESSTIH